MKLCFQMYKFEEALKLLPVQLPLPKQTAFISNLRLITTSNVTVPFLRIKMILLDEGQI